MLQWLEFTPILVAMVATVVLPGYFWVRSTARSSVVAAAAAPALTFAVISVMSILWHSWGISWSALTVFPVLIAWTVLGIVVFQLRLRARPQVGTILGDHPDIRPPLMADAPAAHAYRILPRRTRAAMWVTIVIGWVVAATPLIANARIIDPAQQWDAVFHLNGVWSILQVGTAQPMGGLSELYGGRDVFYPTAWHAFTALFATPTTVIPVANMTSVLMMGLWVVGGTAFTAMVTTSRTAVVAAPVIAGCMLSMPADALTMYNQWPNALGVALLPGVAALAVMVGRRAWRDSEGGLGGLVALIPQGLLVLIAVLGAISAHPTTVFSLAALLVAPMLATQWRLVRRSWWLKDFASLVVHAIVGVCVIAVPLYLLTTDRLQAMGDYPRHGSSWTQAFFHFLTPYPPFEPTIGFALTLVITTLLVAIGGAFTIIRGQSWSRLVEGAYPDWRRPFRYATMRSPQAPTEDVSALDDAQVDPPTPPSSLDTPPARVRVDATRQGRTRAWIERREQIRDAYGPRPLMWPLATFAVFAALTFLAYSPDSELRTFVLAPWYMDARRIMAVQNLTMVPLAAFGFEFVVNWIRSHRVREEDEHPISGSLWRIGAIVGAWLLALSLGGALDARAWAVGYVYDADNLGKPGMATNAELAMLRRMPRTLPADALVVGDPIAGAAYTEVIGQRQAVFPQLSMASKDEESQQVLAFHFNEIHTNPRVCQVVRDLGITHFYQDADGYYYNQLRSDRSPGLYDVDTTQGFDLIDDGGTARLYRITACD